MTLGFFDIFYFLLSNFEKTCGTWWNQHRKHLGMINIIDSTATTKLAEVMQR